MKAMTPIDVHWMFLTKGCFVTHELSLFMKVQVFLHKISSTKLHPIIENSQRIF
jgi:hypothetical protein